MVKTKYKGRCTKIALSKCSEICRTYSPMQLAYAQQLEADAKVKSFTINNLMEDIDYTSDFLVTQCNGDLFVRECVYRKHLLKPMTVKLLDQSREYWLRRGVVDWGIVIDAEEAD